MWQRVTGRIVRQGRRFWSSKSLRPTQEEIRHILELSGGGVVHVCRSNKNILIFRDNEFVGEGPFFPPATTIPQFASDKDAEYIHWMRKLEDFTVDELARLRFPHIYERGIAWRCKDSPNLWAPTQKLLLEAYGDVDVEEYDYEKLARIRTGNFIYVKAKNEGWVIPTEYGKWKYIGKRK